jgi:hypothetical protein
MKALLGTFLFVVFVSYFFVTNVFAGDPYGCKPICGNPTCCIARKIDIPVCVLSGKQVLNLRKNSDGLAIFHDCIKSVSKEMVPLVEKENAANIERLSCHWGCCQSQQAARYIANNFALVRSKIIGPEMANVIQITNGKEADIGLLQSRIQEARASQRMCIFCCTF